MQISELIHKLKAENLTFEIGKDDHLDVIGKPSKIDEYATVIREHKTAILKALKLEGNYPFLDDRHACLECSNLTHLNGCKQAKRGQFVAMIQANALDIPHRCERFRVNATLH